MNRNKILLVLISLSLLSSLFTYIYDINNTKLIDIELYIGQVFGVMLLLFNSTLVKTIYWKFLMLSFVILIIGAMFKILHWPGTSILISISIFSIMTIYSFRFYKKESKQRIDFLKLIWVLMAFSIDGLTLFHLIKDVRIIDFVLFWLVMIEFVYQNSKTGIFKS